MQRHLSQRQVECLEAGARRGIRDSSETFHDGLYVAGGKRAAARPQHVHQRARLEPFQRRESSTLAFKKTDI